MTEAQKRALLIGVNRYPNLGGRDLRGCVNDARAMATVLKESFGFPPENVQVLCDEEATREGILTAMRVLIEKVSRDEVVVLHYSGHGSQRTSQDVTEGDGLDETIVPHDSGRFDKPNRDITDKEIHAWLGQLTERTRNVALIFDSCHSGTITRDIFGEQVRSVEPDERSFSDFPPLEFAAGSLGDLGKSVPSGWLPIGERYVLISGCRDEEQSFEYGVARDGETITHGALTYFLLQAMVGAVSGTTYRDAFERTSVLVSAEYPRQHPQFEGGGRDRELFGVRDIEPVRFVPVKDRDGEVVTLGAGAIHGLEPGSEWGVYPQGAKAAEEANREGRVRVEIVGSFESRAVVLGEEPGGAIGAGSRAVEEIHSFGDLRLGVEVVAPPDHQHLAGPLIDEIESSFLLRRVQKDTEAELRVYLVPARSEVSPEDPVPQLGAVTTPLWVIVGKDGRMVAPHRTVDSPGVAAIVTDNLERLARYRKALGLGNPNPVSPLRGKVDLVLLRQTAGGAWAPPAPDAIGGEIAFGEGDLIAAEIVNGHDAPIYVALLDFGLTGGISQLHPPRGAQELLAAGGRVRVGVGMNPGDQFRLQTPEGFPFGREPKEPSPPAGLEILKLFATTGNPVDFESLLQEGVRGSPPTRERAEPFSRLLSLAFEGQGTRDVERQEVELPPDEDWITIDRTFLLHSRRAGESPGGSDAPATGAASVGPQGAESARHQSPAGAQTEAESKPALSQGGQTGTHERPAPDQPVSAPTITNHPQPVRIAPGAKARFEVAADGGGLAYQWLRGSAEIAGATRSVYEFEAREEDDGAEFSAVVRNDSGSVTSAAARLSVAGETPAVFDARFAGLAALVLGLVFLLVLWPLWLLAGRVIGDEEAVAGFSAAVAIQLVIVGVALALGALYLTLLEFRGRARTAAEVAAAAESAGLSGRGFGEEAIKALPEALKSFGQLKAFAAILAIAGLLFVCATVIAWRGLQPESPSPSPTPSTTAPADDASSG